jgi:hypothetical protein
MNPRSLIVVGVLLGAIGGCIELGFVVKDGVSLDSSLHALLTILPIIQAVGLLVAAWAWIALLPLLASTDRSPRLLCALFGFAALFLLSGFSALGFLLIPFTVQNSSPDWTQLLDQAFEALGSLLVSAGFVGLGLSAKPKVVEVQLA